MTDDSSDDARPAALNALDVLVGSWELETEFAAEYFGPGSAAVKQRGGTTTWEWMIGERFLIQCFHVDHPAAPSGLCVIGLDDAGEHLVQHYYDSRGVARDYAMKLADRQLELKRIVPGFSQRYVGAIAADGQTIAGAWQMSEAGDDWNHDFNLTYRRVR